MYVLCALCACVYDVAPSPHVGYSTAVYPVDQAIAERAIGGLRPSPHVRGTRMCVESYMIDGCHEGEWKVGRK